MFKTLRLKIREFIEADPFDSEHIICNLEDIEAFSSLSIKDKVEMVSKLKDDRIGKGRIFFNGFQVVFDPADRSIRLVDKRIAVVSLANKRNRPMAKIEFASSVYKVIIGDSVFIKPSTTEPIVLKCPAKSLISLHGSKYVSVKGEEGAIEPHRCVFSDDSVKEYYSFSNFYFIDFTKSVVERYWRNDCPILTRYTINKHGNTNAWGLSFFTWENNIIEPCGWSDVCLDEDITKAEIKAITKGYEETAISKAIYLKYYAAHDTNEKNKQDKKDKFNDIYEKVKDAISGEDEKIMEEALKRLGVAPHLISADKTEKIKLLLSFEAPMDCGFLSFFFKDQYLHDLTKIVAHYGCKCCKNGTFSLSVPVLCQSITVLSAQANAIVDIVREKTGVELCFKTTLD